MKNVSTHIGTLEVLERLKSSANGNPRFLLRINGLTCRTIVDSNEAYGITNFDGKTVSADLGVHYDRRHCRNVHLVSTERAKGGTK